MEKTPPLRKKGRLCFDFRGESRRWTQYFGPSGIILYGVLVMQRKVNGAQANRGMEELLRDPQLPTLPAIALRIVETVSDPNCSFRELAKLIHQDPALCASILRTVNSALYSLPRRLSSVEHAMGILGLKAVRSIALCLALPSLQSPQTNPVVSQAFWKAAVGGATIAREMSLRLKSATADDDLVAALLRDVGALVLAAYFPAEHEQIATNRRRHPDEICELEKARFGFDHAELSAALLERWGLPEEIVTAVRWHHMPDAPKGLAESVGKRWQVLRFATLAAEMFVYPEAPVLCGEVAAAGRELFQLEPDALQQLLEPVGEKMADLADVMQVEIGPCENYAHVLSRGLKALSQLNFDQTCEKLQVESAKEDALLEAYRWRKLAAAMRKTAYRDSVTGLYGRAVFEDKLAIEFERAARNYWTLGVLYIDLDGFKPCNDRHGHAFGDHVLREVGRRLTAHLRPYDIVARIGGDEFAVVVPEIWEDDLRRNAERLLKAISHVPIRHDGAEARVGASIGAVLCLPYRRLHTPQEVVEFADKAMYESKANGKNRVTFRSLISPDDREFEEAIAARRFSNYLIRRWSDNACRIMQACGMSKTRAPLISRIARRLGWLSREEVASVLREQRKTRRPFVEIAQEKGLLSEEEILGLLAIQRESPEDVADRLVQLEVFSPEQRDREVRRYYETLRGA